MGVRGRRTCAEAGDTAVATPAAGEQMGEQLLTRTRVLGLIDWLDWFAHGGKSGCSKQGEKCGREQTRRAGIGLEVGGTEVALQVSDRCGEGLQSQG